MFRALGLGTLQTPPAPDNFFPNQCARTGGVLALEEEEGAFGFLGHVRQDGCVALSNNRERESSICVCFLTGACVHRPHAVAQ